MKIDLTTKQYEGLLKILYLGMEIAVENEESIDELEALKQHILSLAPAFNLREYIDYDEGSNHYDFSDLFEERTQVGDILDSYQNRIFWEELVYGLVDRDLANEFGIEQINRMTPEEIVKLQEERAQKYMDEFETNGIQNLKVQK